MTHLKLTYFNDGKGRNELTRLIFAVGSIPYEDELIDYPTFKSLRDSGKLPFGQVPILTVDGRVFGQSCSIAHYAAKISGLYPSDPLDALEADGVVDSWRDTLDLFYETVFGRVVIDEKLTMTPHPRPLRRIKLNALVKTELLNQFCRYNRMIEGKNQFCREMFPCYADLAIYDLVKTIECALEKPVFDNLVRNQVALTNLVRRVDDLEPIKKHLEKYPYREMQHLYRSTSAAKSA